ncbi:unnamed protein product [Paramecium octaurelia]|uniref:CobW C-terminal domain-containing protein n=1 Tax=Paramecium octaurelia TaxID=43137 RepID=A0A8S1TT84_PAROT|nr:unnamed protein product [Paramecium octaurelia]
MNHTLIQKQYPSWHMNHNTKIKKLPVTVLCGFLGSGKTTLLNYILKQRHDCRIAVIVNDMGEINVDSNLIKEGKFSVKKTKEKLVEMSNGCICCTLREDLIKHISKIAKSGKFDYMLIESTGIAEPLPIAQAFYFENEEMRKKGQMLKKFARLDTMVTMIDALNFLDQLQSDKQGEEMNVDNKQMDQIPLSQLLLDQVEFANVIILNKTDLVEEERKEFILNLLKKLNPNAKIIESIQGQIDLKEIINTKLFNFEEASTTGKWIAELQKPIHKSEIEEYGIQSCAFKSRRAFHPAKLFQLIERNNTEELSFWNNIIRCKGYMWVASWERLNIHIHKAGTQLTYHPGSFWWISIPKKVWADTKEEVDAIWDGVKNNWLPEPIGDRRQELVFIGQNLPKQEILDAFESCLLSEQEMVQFLQNGWDNTNDPFPKDWGKLVKEFEDLGELRGNEGEWEDVWDEEGEMQEEHQEDESMQEEVQQQQ